MTYQAGFALLADLILCLHFALATFIVFGLIYVWIAGACQWSSARNRRFRLTHLAAMGFIAFEAVIGMVCPLTRWESDLRTLAGVEAPSYDAGFIQYWVGNLLYYDLPEEIFFWGYLIFFLLILVTYRVIPPHSRVKGAVKLSSTTPV